MTTVLMIRHAATDSAGSVLTGRRAGIHLNESGFQEADRLAHFLRASGVHALYCSPLERAQETARPISEILGVPITTCDSLNEFDFGCWTGNMVDQLRPTPLWNRFNTLRSITAAPGGELMIEIQTRVIKLMESIRLEHPERVVACVSHGDVIRAALCHYLGMPLDFFQRLDISPASISTVVLEEDRVTVHGVNQKVPDCLGTQPHDSGQRS